MICVLQRLAKAGVHVGGKHVAAIGRQLPTPLAVVPENASEDVACIARKLRVFAGDERSTP